MQITRKELSEHCSKYDAWMAVNGHCKLRAFHLLCIQAKHRVITLLLLLLLLGVVYNITPYLDFHPGNSLIYPLHPTPGILTTLWSLT